MVLMYIDRQLLKKLKKKLIIYKSNIINKTKITNYKINISIMLIYDFINYN